MLNIIAIAFLIICAVISIVIASFAQGKKNNSSLLHSSISEISSVIAEKEVSSIAVVEQESSLAPSSSSQQSSSRSQTLTSSKKQSASVNSVTAANNSSLIYDITSVAENWTYVIDKSKPVPLQPRVEDSFFSSAMFVGDSITTGIDLYSIIKGAPVVAYTGINTNTVLTRQVIRTSQGKITFLQQMAKYDPKHIYIMMGINGIAFQTKSNLIDGYAKFVDRVKAQHPNAIIYLQSILPVTAKKQQNDSRFANKKINEYNAAILKLAKEKGVYYLNVAEAFKDGNGNLPANASSDGIHFGPAYYKRWIEYLKTHTVYTGKIPQVESSTSSKTVSVVRPPVSSQDSISSTIAETESTVTQ